MTRRQAGITLLFLAFALTIPTFFRARDVLQARMNQTDGPVPTTVSYQGQVTVDGEPYSGQGYFKFALTDLTVSAPGSPNHANVWTNDGSSLSTGDAPTAAVPILVTDGLFSVLLGKNMSGMSAPLTPAEFEGPDRSLRVWFSQEEAANFVELTPEVTLSSAPYAMQAANAETLDGMSAAELIQAASAEKTENLILVAKSGGDFDSIQEALDSIEDAAEYNGYTVVIAAGRYFERITMKPYVEILGSGENSTLIQSNASGVPDGLGTVNGANLSGLRNLTVETRSPSNSEGYEPIGISNDGVSPQISNVNVKVWQGKKGRGIVNKNAAAPRLTNVNVRVGVGHNDQVEGFGIHNIDSRPLLQDVDIYVDGGKQAIAVLNEGASPIMERVSVRATTSEHPIGVMNTLGSKPTMTDVTVSTSWGYQRSTGIANLSGSAPTIRKSQISALGEETPHCIGILNQGASAYVSHSRIDSGRVGCTVAIGILNDSLEEDGHHLYVEHSNIFGTDNDVASDSSQFSVEVSLSNADGRNGFDAPGARCAYVVQWGQPLTRADACP